MSRNSGLSSHAQAKGTTCMVAVARASTGLTTHRPASARVRAWCHRSRDPSAGRAREPVCESHDSTGEPGAGDRPAGFGERGEETCSRESDCGPVAKAPDEPPIPTGYAPPLDSTSFKGGAGRSTALAATALHLAAAGERVAVLDADLDAPGVGTLLAGYDGAVASCGITDYLLEQRILGNPAGIDTEDYHHRYAPDGGRGAGEIVVCPAGRFDSRYMESSPESTTGSPRMAHRIPSLCSCSGSVRTSHQVGS